MRLHAKKKPKKPTKMAQMFWALDADTQQPVCFTTATASRTVAQATPQLLDIASSILDPQPGQALVMADANQSLGWKRAGTTNLNIRYGQMTMALVAQAVIHQLRDRLGDPVSGWDADHLAKDIFRGLDGDVRVNDDTIIVTYYNAPNESRLREHYENLPDKLSQENIDPHLPWLYNFKLDFRFR